MIIGLAYLLVLASVPLARGAANTRSATCTCAGPASPLAAIVIQIVRYLAAPERRPDDPHDPAPGVLLPARRVRVLQPPRRGRADHRVRRAAQLRRDRRQRRRHAGRSGRHRLARAHSRRGRVRELAGPRRPQAPVPRRPLRLPASLPLHNVFSIGDGDPADRRLRARPRRLRLAPGPAALRGAVLRSPPDVPRRRSPGRPRGASSPRTPSRPSDRPRVRRAAAAGLRPLRHAMGGRRRAAARPAAGDRASARCSARSSTASAGAPARSSRTPCAASPSWS